MLEMLKERKAALEAQGKKGFTLMEMLIVIAIIAVLIAIAIPIFTAQLEKSREATDMANIRSAYAEVTAAYLSNNKPQSIDVKVQSNASDWQSDANAEIAGVKAKDAINGRTGDTVKVEVDGSGNAKIGGTAVPQHTLAS